MYLFSKLVPTNKYLSALLLLLVPSLSAYSQTNFQPGYIITLTGDTVRGEVDARGAMRNAHLSRFRASADGAITAYQPEKLRGYGFTNDRQYQSARVHVTDIFKPEASTGAALPDTVSQPVFLEVIVSGPASLLYLRNAANDEHYYLRTPTGTIRELVQRNRQVVLNGNTYQEKTNEFRPVLASAMQGCMAVQPAISKVRLQVTDLTKLVRQYNECVGGSTVAAATASRRNSLRLGVVVGGQKSQLTTSSSIDPKELNASAGIAPVAGLALQLGLGGVNKTIAFRLEALYEQQKHRGAVDYRDDAGYDLTREIRTDLASIRIPLLVRYTFPRGIARPFAQVGYSVNYFLKTDNETRYRYVNRPAFPDYSAWRTYIDPTRPFEQGLVAGVGLTTARTAGRNAAVEFRYEKSNGYSNATAISNRLNRFYFLLSYDLTK